MLVVVDEFEWEDYPVYVGPGGDVRQVYESYNHNQNMQRCMEVYNLSKNKDLQIGQCRCFEF